MGFVEYEKTTNLFVQAMKGTSLGATLRKVNASRWAVMVPQSVILDELGLGVISNDFLRTHTIIFNSVELSDSSFATLNGIVGHLAASKSENNDPTVCDNIILEIPADEGGLTTPTPLGPTPVDIESPVTPSSSQQVIQILRQTELEIDPTDGFTIPIYLVADAIRAKWVRSDPLESIGWHSEKQQEPRVQSSTPLQPSSSSLPPTPSNSQQVGTSSSSGSRSPKSAPKPPPKFRFRDFAEKMRHQKAAGIHSKLKHFVAEINTSPTPEDPTELPKKVQNFLLQMFEEISENPVWKGASAQEMDFAQEGLEKYILTKVFHKTFGTEEDRKSDEALEKRLESFKFIEPQNLDVKPAILEHVAWKEAVEELNKLNEYKNPRDKLICIANSCKLIFSALHFLDPGKAMGADDFLPCLILLVGKANAKQLHSNTNFIENYRNSAKMSSEAGYYFCTLQSAIHFWENADASSLRISQSQLDTINEGLADIPLPDFSNVSIDQEDGWDEKNRLGMTLTCRPDGTSLLMPDNGQDESSVLLSSLKDILSDSAPSDKLPSSLSSATVKDIKILQEEWVRLSHLKASVASLVTT